MEHKITDADFWKTFAIISVIIIVLAIFIAIISNVFASYSSSGDDNYKTELQSLTNDRTKPSGKINLQSNPSIKPKSKPIVTASKKLSGKEVYNAACMSCHASGAAGAPMTGNKDQWSDRLSKWFNAFNTCYIYTVYFWINSGSIVSVYATYFTKIMLSSFSFELIKC